MAALSPAIFSPHPQPRSRAQRVYAESGVGGETRCVGGVRARELGLVADLGIGPGTRITCSAIAGDTYYY